MAPLLISAVTLNGWKTVSDIASDVATIGAVVVGAIWAYLAFIRERARWPRAQLWLDFDERLLYDEKAFLDVKVRVKNEGRGRLRFADFRVDLYRVAPLDAPTRRKIENGTQFDPGQVQASWKLLGQHRRDFESTTRAELEPGEMEDFHFDFFISPELETVSVYAYVENEFKSKRKKFPPFRRKHPLGWAVTGIYDVKSTVKKKRLLSSIF